MEQDKRPPAPKPPVKPTQEPEFEAPVEKAVHAEKAPQSVSSHPFLTAEQVEAAKVSARKKLDAERTKEAMKEVEAEETERLRREEGLVTGGVRNELVWITLDLPEFSNRIILNSEVYWHGTTREVPRHVADTLQEIMYRQWQHQAEIDGKSARSIYARQHVKHLYDTKSGGVILSANQ